VRASAWQQQQLAGGAPGREILVRTGCRIERVRAADADTQPTLADPGEQVARPAEQLLAAGDARISSSCRSPAPARCAGGSAGFPS
jgi:hypothetical protein